MICAKKKCFTFSRVRSLDKNNNQLFTRSVSTFCDDNILILFICFLASFFLLKKPVAADAMICDNDVQ